MRYFNVEDIDFTNSFGKSVKLKDILPVADKATSSVNIALSKDDALDEIATRADVWGDGYESRAYNLFAENIEELTQNDFDLNRLKTLRIPI